MILACTESPRSDLKQIVVSFAACGITEALVG
jgi:hypothetical protein